MIRYLIEFAIIHTVLIGAYWLFLKNERQYGRLRLYLLASTFLSLLVPALRLPAIQSFFTPDSPMTVLVTQLEPMQYISAQEPAPQESGSSALYWVYALISGWLLIKVIMGLVYLFKLRINSKKHLFFGINLRKVVNLDGSFSFFNWIFVNEKVEEDEENVLPIVKHEQAHVRLRHSYDLMFYQLFRVVFWWLPSAWYINQEIKKIHEFQADAYALKSYSFDQYSSILISSTLKSNGLSLASSFHDGLILKRLNAMKQQMKKISPWKLSSLGVLTAILVITFACNEELIQSSDLPTEALTVVEHLPEPQDGWRSFYKYVSDNLNYPTQARKEGIHGRVHVEFVVNADGSLRDIKTKRGIGGGCEEEVERVLALSNDWIPGKQGGINVAVRMVMPITFKLADIPSPNERTLDLPNQTREVMVIRKSISDPEPIKLENIKMEPIKL